MYTTIKIMHTSTIATAFPCIPTKKKKVVVVDQVG
jgi:hypothetical protein